MSDEKGRGAVTIARREIVAQNGSQELSEGEAKSPEKITRVPMRDRGDRGVLAVAHPQGRAIRPITGGTPGLYALVRMEAYALRTPGHCP